MYGIPNFDTKPISTHIAGQPKPLGEFVTGENAH